jgi:tRNA(fMet)-specific endonuclease VapC
MRYLFDTCVISDFVRGEPGTQTRLKQTPPAEVAVSVITVMELAYGLALHPQRTQKIKPVIDDFLSSVLLLPFGVPESDSHAYVGLIRSLPCLYAGSTNPCFS